MKSVSKLRKLLIFPAKPVKTVYSDVGDALLHAAYSVQNNVEDVEDIKTSHNRFLTDFVEFI